MCKKCEKKNSVWKYERLFFGKVCHSIQLICIHFRTSNDVGYACIPISENFCDFFYVTFHIFAHAESLCDANFSKTQCFFRISKIVFSTRLGVVVSFRLVHCISQTMNKISDILKSNILIVYYDFIQLKIRNDISNDNSINSIVYKLTDLRCHFINFFLCKKIKLSVITTVEFHYCTTRYHVSSLRWKRNCTKQSIESTNIFLR